MVVFALVTAEIAAHGDDVDAGVSAAIGWIAEHLRVYSANFVLTTRRSVGARYPAADELCCCHDAPGTAVGALDAAPTHPRRLRGVASPSVCRSEPMDDDRVGARCPVALIHVDADLTVHCRLAFPDPPAHLLTLADLQPETARSQTADARSHLDRRGGAASAATAAGV